ncbi:hypothetical protein IKD48_02395 [bacterium]|nr:hypothetical protein [bacterium]MBR2652134.1 hypothetical protein [bacterium]
MTNLVERFLKPPIIEIKINVNAPTEDHVAIKSANEYNSGINFPYNS